ncbi:MAG: GYF domain-containing protein [Planctomycetaceae bacterium]
MADDWFYTRTGERFGPVPLAKVKALADEGWLVPEDLVWGPGMADWRPAASVKGIFRSSLVDSLASGGGVIPGIRPRQDEPGAASAEGVRRGIDRLFSPEFFEHVAPRHLVAAGGAFLAALGIAFTAIAPSSLGLALTLGGLALAAAGMHVEVGSLAAQAAANVAKSRKEAHERRLETQRLAVEKQRLEVEAARLAAEREARQRPAHAAPPLEPPVPAATAGGPQPVALPPPIPRVVPADYYGPGEHVTVITHPPVQRWSPGLAAVLSFLLPGLGQVYKGQVINGLVWFVLVGLGYLALVLPGLVLHFFCIVGAASGNPWSPGRTEVVRV